MAKNRYQVTLQKDDEKIIRQLRNIFEEDDNETLSSAEVIRRALKIALITASAPNNV